MTSVLRDIETLANDIAKDYTNLHLVVRGTPTFCDQNLRGSIRFAQRQGNFLPVIAPDNSTNLAADVVPPIDTLTLGRIPTAFTTLGAVLTIGPGRELVEVVDVDTIRSTIRTAADIVGTHAAGTQVDLYGVPVSIIGNQAQADTVIQLRSDSIVVIGDEIAIATTPDLLSSTVPTRVTYALFLGMTIDGRYNYEVTLAEGLARSLVNDETILLRAQPGYESLPTRVNQVRGPFLIDFVSGPFFEATEIDEYLNVQLLNALGSPLTGYDAPVSVGKNFPVTNVPVAADSMLFWNVVRGSVSFESNRFIAVTDTDGRFLLSTELVPSFPAGSEWEVPVEANDTTLLRVRFEPNAYRDVSLVNGIVTRMRIGAAGSEEDATRIEIAIHTQRPGSRVWFNDWLTTTSAVASLVYQVTSTAYGTNVWQAGSLMLKPYFLTLDQIRARYDFTGYDRGAVHL